MAHIDGDTEQRIADRRARHRQSKSCPLLIRDDGMLYPNTPLVARNPRFRPYHGDPKASLQDRLRFLNGLGAKRAVTFTVPADEPFDIGAADSDGLINFAMEQYGAVLDPAKPVKKLREEVFRLSQLDEESAGSASAGGDDGEQGGSTGGAPAAPQRRKPGPKPKGLSAAQVE